MVQTRRATVVRKELTTKKPVTLRTVEATMAAVEAKRARKISKEIASSRAKEATRIRLSKLAKGKAKQSKHAQDDVEARALLSAKRKQAAASRWNKSSANKDQRIKAVEKTTKTLPVRKSQSTQVDFSSPVIDELRHSLKMKDDKYRCLEQRLTKSDRKKLKLQKKCFPAKDKKIAELILGSKRQTLSYEEFHQTSESVRHELHILSPEKKSSESAKLAPLEDIRLCISMSGRQRSQLKSELIKVKKDIFAPTHQVRQHLEQISAELELESSISNGKQFTWVSNVKIILERRLSRLHQSGSLDFSGRFGGNVFLFFVADKGGTTTKCAIGIGNVKRANSADNLLLISLFDDSDDHQNLDKLKDVLFNQLLFESVRVGGEEKAVKWFATGDLKILSALYGHMGSSSTFSCLLCEAPKNSFKDNNIYPARTLFSIDQGFCRYLYFSDAALSRKRTEQLGKNSKSISKQPILNVPIAHIVPPSLHIVQGLAQNTVNLMEEMNPELVPQLEIVYRSLGADKQNFYQTFTGNHIRKLLTGEGPSKIARMLPAGLMQSVFFKLLSLLGEIQSYARASFLVEDEIDHFETKTNQFFECMRENFPQSSVSPKGHYLRSHVGKFMRHHGFWGLLSEQSIEALHAKVNKDERRLASLRNRIKIQKKIVENSYVRNVLNDGMVRCFDENVNLEDSDL